MRVDHCKTKNGLLAESFSGRDVTTLDGRELTLLDLANLPDAWETRQPEAFSLSQCNDVWGVADIDSLPADFEVCSRTALGLQRASGLARQLGKTMDIVLGTRAVLGVTVRLDKAVPLVAAV